VQGDHGSPTLDMLLEPAHTTPRFWFHGHSTPVKSPTVIGYTTVVPLGDVAFRHGKPGLDGWAFLAVDDDRHALEVTQPPFWREVQQKHWRHTSQGLLVHPDLARFRELYEDSR
jgi:hypothetical protein